MNRHLSIVAQSINPELVQQYNDPNKKSGQNKSFESFYVDNFRFIVKHIKYSQDTGEVTPPSLEVYLDKEIVFQLSSDAKQMEFSNIMFGLKLEPQSDEVLNLSGDNRRFFVVSTYSGGVHCCRIYYILELMENGIKVLQRIETQGSKLDFIQPTSPQSGYILKYKDSSFANFYSSYEQSAFPEVILSYQPRLKKFSADIDLMRLSIRDLEFRKSVSTVTAAVEQNYRNYGDLNITINPIIQQSIRLIYNGNAKRAFELIDASWPMKFKKIKKERFLYDLKCNLQSSNLWEDIQRINPGIPVEDCS
jgi:hypothetical protein